jgi:hypothetical protein
MLPSSGTVTASWKFTSRTATQEFPNFLWNKKIYHRVQRSSPYWSVTCIFVFLVVFNFLDSLTHEAEPFLRSCQLCSHSSTSHDFMEPEVSLPCWQSPPLVPILNQINPIHTIPSYLKSISILSTHPRLGLPSGLLPSGFPTNILYAFLSTPMPLDHP